MNNCKECGHFTRNPKFCSMSCAATYNNRAFPKRGVGDGMVCPSCGGKKWYASRICRLCVTEEQEVAALKRPIEEMFQNGSARTKYVQIRSWARKLMHRAGRMDKCEECDFDAMVEVSHIKSIASFPSNTQMGVVNHHDNMRALCPNHHVLHEMALSSRQSG